MGGKAFYEAGKEQQSFPTPRMPPEIYEIVLAQTLETLRKCYTHAESPIEAPEKVTYGDIDILVTGPITPGCDPTVSQKEAAEEVKRILGARECKSTKGNPTINYLIPWPRSGETSDEKFIQVDIHHLVTVSQFKWELFHSAHGDLWNMLGSTIRPLGLTANDKGLYIRIEEVEKIERKKSFVFLTSDPSKVLRFLGLEEDKWWTRFETKNEMFEYVARSRCFWIKDLKSDEAYGDVIAEMGDIEAQEGGQDGKKKLKHNDRQRMSKRPLFAEWIEKFIPSCREAGRYTTARATREQIRQDAFNMFGVREEYEERLKKWTIAKHVDELWRITIKGSIPVEGVDPALRGAASRALKASILEGEIIDGIEIPTEVKRGENGFWNHEAVKRFVVSSWSEIGTMRVKKEYEMGVEKMKQNQKRKREASLQIA